MIQFQVKTTSLAVNGSPSLQSTPVLQRVGDRKEILRKQAILKCGNRAGQAGNRRGVGQKVDERFRDQRGREHVFERRRFMQTQRRRRLPLQQFELAARSSLLPFRSF